MLGENEDWLLELSICMEPEDGRIYVVVSDDETITAFSKFGIENLEDLIKEVRNQTEKPA